MAVRSKSGELAFGLAFALFCLAAFAGTGVRAVAAPGSSNDFTKEDFQSVKAVCTRCHAASLFMKNPRTWNRWNETFARMSAHGARPTPEQVDHIVRYFLANLTFVNVNSAPADELSVALGVSESTADAIVARRSKRKFRDLRDLLSIAGVEPALLEKRKARIQF
jgi:hypothetical protein